MTFRPILGAGVKYLGSLRYPLLASFKLDGIRAIWWGKEFISRTCKAIPNRSLQEAAVSLNIPSGWDGELIYGEPNDAAVYRNTIHSVMSKHGPIDKLRFFVFDNCEDSRCFADRNQALHDVPPLVLKLDQMLVHSPEEVLAYEERALDKKYEGLILRSPTGPYKQGRSTLREQYLLKLKRFADAEAEIIDFEELLHNANEATLDERGYTERSSHAENKVPMGILGAIVCRMEGVVFRIGTGFSQNDRRTIWRDRDRYLGKLAKFKFFPIGIKTAPRHPVWLGWREKIDL